MSAIENKKTAIINAKIFDGIDVIGSNNILIEGNIISQIGGEIPADAEVIDAKGLTL